MTTQERLTKAQAFLDASDELSARELVDSVLEEEPHNSVALRLDDAIARQNVSEFRDQYNADKADLGFMLPGRGAIIVGLALALLGIITLAYIGGQLRASRPPGITTQG